MEAQPLRAEREAPSACVVTASGATEWRWDFGDSGGVFGPWSNDPVNGKSPTHAYSSTGAKTVRVQVRNCAAGPVTSANLAIDVRR